MSPKLSTTASDAVRPTTTMSSVTFESFRTPCQTQKRNPRIRDWGRRDLPWTGDKHGSKLSALLLELALGEKNFPTILVSYEVTSSGWHFLENESEKKKSKGDACNVSFTCCGKAWMRIHVMSLQEEQTCLLFYGNRESLWQMLVFQSRPWHRSMIKSAKLHENSEWIGTSCRYFECINRTIPLTEIVLVWGKDKPKSMRSQWTYCVSANSLV